MTKTMRLRQLNAVYKLLDDVFFFLQALVPGGNISTVPICPISYVLQHDEILPVLPPLVKS